MSDKSLFRKEALNFRAKKLHGNILLYQPISFKILTVLLLTIISMIFIFLLTCNFSRKVSVTGYLVPDRGVIDVFGKSDGLLKRFYFNEGDFVESGTKIAHVVNQQTTLMNGKTTVAQNIDELKFQLKKNIEKLKSLNKLHTINKNLYQSELKLAKEALAELIKKQSIYDERVVLAKQNLLRLKQLMESKYISKAKIQELKSKDLDILQGYYELTQKIVDQKEKILTLENKLTKLPLEQINVLVELQNRNSDIKQRLASLRHRENHFLQSPITGNITNIQFKEGETISKGVFLFSIIPENSNLLAELFVPSKAIGFIKVGQDVKIFYDAFPYQRFGYHEGSVKSISSTTLAQTKAQTPKFTAEPTYTVVVKLEKQTVSAYGKQYNLSSGMKINSDIILEKSNLLDWALEPIHALYAKE